MKRHVILLRGVTPTGRNKVLMAPLREALVDAGLQDVTTYIQSGNVLASSDLSRAKLEAVVHDAIARTQGGDIVVIARTAAEFRGIAARNPWPDAEGTRMYVSLMASRPEKARLDDVASTDFRPDEVRIHGDAIYTLYAEKLSSSTFDNAWFERKLKVRTTTRNLNTVTKLVELATGSS